MINVPSEGPVILDFYADWCGPCKDMAPILEEVSKEFPEIPIIKINVENESLRELQQYAIRAIPTLVFIQDGIFVDNLIGAKDKEALREWIKFHHK